MSNITRHTGVIRRTGSRVYVVYRELLDDKEHCLVIYRDSLPEVYAYKVQDVVLGRGQESINLFDVMDKETLEGAHMLTVLHKYNHLRRVSVDDVDMHVGGRNVISLRVLNQSIDETSEVKDGTVEKYNPMVKNDNIKFSESVGIAYELINQADMHTSEAKALYERAYALDPSLRPVMEIQEEDDNTFIVKLPKNASQAKAVELVKKALKERSNDKQ